MKRCTRTTDLEVHHKRRDRGNHINNAEVLCDRCHQQTATYGTPGKSPPAFTGTTKEAALKRAGYRCECTRKTCDHGDRVDWSNILGTLVVFGAVGVALFGWRGEDVRRFIGNLL